MNRLAALTSVLLLLVVAGVSTSFAAQEKKDKGQEITTREIETFGKDLVDKRCHMNCKFADVQDTWVRLLLKDESYVGIFVRDSKNNLFQFAFANKEKFGRDLLKMSRGDRLRLIGKVKQVESKYVLMVEEIEK